MGRREEIVACGRQMFEERGFAKTSVASITEELGVARSLFYHYFDSKEDLASAVLDTYVDDFRADLNAWNKQRTEGDIDGALDGIVSLLRNELFGPTTSDSYFRHALSTRENASLYIEFINRVAEQLAEYFVSTTVQDYSRLHPVEISYVYDSFYVLILGLAGYMNQHPEVDDKVFKTIIAQSLHLEEER